MQSAALHVLQVERNPHDSVRVVSAQIRLHETVGNDAGFLRIGTTFGKELNSKFNQCGRGDEWHEEAPSGVIRLEVAEGTIGKVSVRLSIRLKRDFPRQTWLAEQGRAW